MHVISVKAIRAACNAHPAAAPALRVWYTAAKAAEWGSLADVRKTFPSADGVRVRSGRTATVFNIGGNNYRLIAAIHYNRQRIYLMRILTHAEYSKNVWKDSL